MRFFLMGALSPGAWYVLYTCEACHRKQVLFPDLSQGKVNINATYHVDCSECGHRGDYDGPGGSIERYQHPETETTSNSGGANLWTSAV